MINSDYAWMTRGGIAHAWYTSGIFSLNVYYSSGKALNDLTFRLVISPNLIV